MSHLSWLEAGVVGAMQGVAELFPVSSLGHSVLLPAVVGGSWARDLNVRTAESPYLAFIVGLHVATAVALIIFFWRDWLRIVRGLATSIARREVADPDQRLAWLLVLATIPVGIVGLVGEHAFRTTLARPVPTACFLIVNGIVLVLIERSSRARKGEEDTDYVDERLSGQESDRRIVGFSVRRAGRVG
jgi:undecaprenyl-diphosphatase